MKIWKEPEYKLVTSEDQLLELRDILKEAIDTDVPISIDVETTGPSPRAGLDRHHGWLLGISFCVNKDEGFYLPLGHTKNGLPLTPQISTKYAKEILNPIISNGGIYIAHNANFDYGFLWRAGFTIFPNFWCTMNACRLLNGDARLKVTLKTLIKKYVEMPSNVVQTFEDASQGNAAEQDPIDFCTYAINDTIFAYYLYEEFKPRIDAQYFKLFYKAEGPLSCVLAQMEMRGIRIDTEYYKNIKHPLEKCRDKIASSFKKRYDLNIASPLQLGKHMIKHFPVSMLDRSTTTNNLKTDVEALQKIRRIFKKSDPISKFAKHILFFRGINKALTTYIHKYPAICHQHYRNGEVEHILHTKFNQMVNSGRMSSSPNVQNLTRDNEVISVRRGFVARKGMRLVEADWKGMELRIVAIDSEESKMLEAFRNDPINADLHTLTAQSIFAKKRVSDKERHIAKTINFSILYGATEFSVSKTLNCSKEQAREYLRLFYQTYPGIKKWKEKTAKKVKDLGYTETFYGRRRYIAFDVYPSMQNRWKYEAALRELTNHIIQGTSADILKLSMVAVAQRLAENDLDSYLLTTTHDSIMVETTQPEETAKIMKEIMEVKIKDVLLPIDVVIKDSFAKK